MFGLSGRFATLLGSVAGGPGGPDGGPVGGPFGPGGAVGGPRSGLSTPGWLKAAAAASASAAEDPLGAGASFDEPAYECRSGWTT